MDLLATCYDDKSRPPPLSHRHVATYLARVAAGLDPVPSDLASTSATASAGGPMGLTWGLDALHSPREPDAAAAIAAAAPGSPSLRLGNASLNSSAGAMAGGLGSQSLNAGAGANMPGSSGSSGPMAATAMMATGGGLPVATAGVLQTLPGPDSWDALFETADVGSGISVDTKLLDFGASSKLVAAEQKSVTVTNNTSAKLLAFVIVPAWQDPNGGASHVAYQVGEMTRRAIGQQLLCCCGYMTIQPVDNKFSLIVVSCIAHLEPTTTHDV